MLSRQEELKERARVLLEQARRDAAFKAGTKHGGSTAPALCSRQLNDVRSTGRRNHTGFSVVTVVMGEGGQWDQSLSIGC